MSVLLTTATYVNGVLTPSGTTVTTLAYTQEEELVARGNATWVTQDTIPTPGPSGTPYGGTASLGTLTTDGFCALGVEVAGGVAGTSLVDSTNTSPSSIQAQVSPRTGLLGTLTGTGLTSIRNAAPSEVARATDYDMDVMYPNTVGNAPTVRPRNRLIGTINISINADTSIPQGQSFKLASPTLSAGLAGLVTVNTASATQNYLDLTALIAALPGLTDYITITGYIAWAAKATSDGTYRGYSIYQGTTIGSIAQAKQRSFQFVTSAGGLLVHSPVNDRLSILNGTKQVITFTAEHDATVLPDVQASGVMGGGLRIDLFAF